MVANLPFWTDRREAVCLLERDRRLFKMISYNADAGDDGTNDLVVSDVIRRNEFQVCFVAGDVVAMPLVDAE